MVSPGFMPRPSLSGRGPAAHPALCCRVAGVHAPAFVERRRPIAGCRSRRCVVSPGFMPRPSLSVLLIVELFLPCPHVSPGFMPRPSLSGHDRARPRTVRGGVAGVHAPAFVERACGSSPTAQSRRVSPGFMPRPSLSDRVARDPGRRLHVSPGFMPRPSLSASERDWRRIGPDRVAGVHAPAFVERSSADAAATCACAGVAGVHAPAFVER